MEASSSFETALLEEIKRFSAEELQGPYCVLGEGNLLHPAAREPRQIILATRDQVGAKEILGYLTSALEDEKGVHAETAVAVLAASVGHLILDRYRGDLSGVPPEAEAVYLEDVNQDLLDAAAFMESVHGQRGGASTVEARIPEEHLPKLGVAAVAASCAPRMSEGLTGTGVEPEQVRWILPYALLGLIDMTKEVLPPPVAFRLAFRHMVRGAKTPPARLAQARWDE